MAKKAESKVTPVKAATTEVVAKKDRRSKAEIFEGSLAKIRSTGNPELDAVAKKVLTNIHSGELVMTGTEEKGYTGRLAGKVDVSIMKVTTVNEKSEKETNRYKLAIGKDISLGGQFAAKAFRHSRSQNRPAGAPSYNQEAVSAVAALLLD